MSHPRPLSPHLQIYQPQITWVLSITHRMTGIGLSLGLFLFSWWIIAVASGPQSFDIVQGFIGSWIGQLMLLGWTFALCFHFLNGLRHLAWDAGYGYDLPTMRLTGWAVVMGTLVLTTAIWVVGYRFWITA